MFKFPKKSKPIDAPDNFLTMCNQCKQMVVTTTLIKNFNECPHCNAKLRRTPQNIIEHVLDEKSFKEKFKVTKVVNPINLKGYEKKQQLTRDMNKIDEAVVCGVGKIDGQKVAIGIMDSRYIMGSLGSLTGDKITLLVEYATKVKLPIIIFTASGGARMQEGIISLMQMGKVVNALKKHHRAGLFYMPILMNPTTGGVTASFAQIGDVIIAEEEALICFAGPRVIKETIKQELPEGFQTAEFLLEKGFVDKIVKRSEQRDFISIMIRLNRGKYGKNN